MYDLCNYTANEAVTMIAEEIASERGITKTEAKKLVINALMFCTVIEEIKGKIDFLIGEE